ncbi:MAG: hypothetical protein ABI369_03540 [Acetobacteraceae bacterium]
MFPPPRPHFAQADRRAASPESKKCRPEQGFVQFFRSNGLAFPKSPARDRVPAWSGLAEEGLQPMPILERREIEFDAEAVLKAVSFPGPGLRAFGLPIEKPAGVRFSPATESIELLFADTTVESVQLKAEALGALLVSHCMNAGIPIPRVAVKAVRIDAAAVILTFTSRLREALPINRSGLKELRKPRAMSWRTPR